MIMIKIIFRFALILMLSISVFDFASLNGQNSDYKKYINQDVTSSDRYTSGNIYQKDFLLFIDLLKECHPSFADGQKYPFDIDRIKNEGYNWASTCKSTNELRTYLQSIATLLKDGHTSLVPILDKKYIYPFIFFKENSSFILNGIDEPYSSFIGKEIIEINGKPVLDVVNSFRNAICSDNEIYYYDKVNSFMQMYSMWEGNPYSIKDSSLTFTFSDKTQIRLNPVSSDKIKIVKPPIKPNSIRINTKEPFVYKLIKEKSICYLQFNSCVDQCSLRSQYNMNRNITNLSEEAFENKVSKIPRFDLFLSDMFQAMKTNKISTLVIDVRDNPGGNSRLCDILLSWLKPIKDTKYQNSFTRISKLWEQNFPALSAEYKELYSQMAKPYELGSLLDNQYLSTLINNANNDNSISKKVDECFMANKDSSMIFDGNVVFIMNSKTYSSASMLIINAVDNNIGTLIGEEGSFRPCSYGDILSWELPNTMINGFVSHKIFSRPNLNKCNEMSIKPDIEINQTWSDIVEGNDVFLNWVLSKYE